MDSQQGPTEPHDPRRRPDQAPPDQPPASSPPQQPGPHGPQYPGPYPPPAGQPPQYPGAYPPQQQPGGYPPQQYPGAYPPQQYPGAYPPQQQPGGYPPQQPPYWSPNQPPPWPGHLQQWPPQPWQGPYAPYGMPPAEPRILPPPPGTPFHQLARNAKYRWWRPLAGTGFLLFLAFCVSAALVVIWAIIHALVTGDLPAMEGTEFFPSDLENLAFTLSSLAILTPAVLFAVWLVQRRPTWSVASVVNRIRWRWLLLACLPGLAYLVVSFGLSALADAVFPTADGAVPDEGSWVGLSAFILPALIIVALVPFQAAAEEFVFRGWLVQAVGAYAPQSTGGNALARTAKRVLRTPWPALVISSAAFVAVHGYTGWAMLDIFMFAMVMGFVTVRTGGIEAAIGLHTLNNVIAFLLPAATGTLEGWAEQGGAPWTLPAVDVPSLAVYVLLVLWLAKRQRLARLSG